MGAILPLLAALAWGAERAPSVTRLEAALSPSAEARRLLAADAGVDRVESHASGLPLAVDERGGSEPEIVVDMERIGSLPPGEAEAEYARALALAAVASPIPLLEAEQASRQWTAQVLVEAAASDPALSKELHGAERTPAAAAPALSGAAAFVARFERSPGSAWWAVESGGAARETASLTELEDLFALHAADVRAMKEAPSEEYADFGGRRYRAALARAAFRLRAPGALERLREALGAYDTVGVEPLKSAIFRWRRAEPASR